MAIWADTGMARGYIIRPSLSLRTIASAKLLFSFLLLLQTFYFFYNALFKYLISYLFVCLFLCASFTWIQAVVPRCLQKHFLSFFGERQNLTHKSNIWKKNWRATWVERQVKATCSLCPTSRLPQAAPQKLQCYEENAQEPLSSKAACYIMDCSMLV